MSLARMMKVGSSTTSYVIEQVAALEAELAKAKDSEETLRMQLVACGVAALSDTPTSSAAQRIGKDNPRGCRTARLLAGTGAQGSTASGLSGAYRQTG